MQPSSFNEVERINDVYSQLHKQLIKVWFGEMLFTWRFWLGLGLLVLPWIFWTFARKKESTQRLLYAGFVVSLISTYLDNIGMAMGLWSYPSKVIPLVPPFLPWDVSLIPVMIMLTLQYKPKGNPFVKAVILSAVGSFIIQPLSEWLGLYYHKRWEHYYSFPFGIVLYLVAYYVFSRKTYNEIH
ncbi:MAG TPA: CBO0543 family protein [Clostridia bacterium]